MTTSTTDAEAIARPVNRIWFDTEFIEDGATIDLISIGMVRSDGATYYAETDQWVPGKASQWVKDNVIVHLRGGDTVKPRDVIAREIVEFAGGDPEFWAYYADYDWVALCQLFGTMMQLPDGWPKFCRDIKQLCADLGDPRLPEQAGTEHYALADALWNKAAWDFLTSRREAQEPVAGELLPCPFCGGAAETDSQQAYRNISTGRTETAVAVYCTSCGAQHTICRGDVPDAELSDVTELWNRRAAPPPAPAGDLGATYSIEHDGFIGTVIGSYTTREGKEGVVLQQVGTKVVHVYGRKWLKTPEAAPAGEVERLREALENIKSAILRADPEILTDTLWMPDDLSRGETVVDHIDAALNGGRADAPNS